jgi:intraflagellar transport protein 74
VFFRFILEFFFTSFFKKKKKKMAYRPPSNAGRPMSTNRPPGSRLGTAFGQQAGGGVSLNTNVNVQARPTVMREGMRGMNTTIGGAGGGQAPAEVPPQTAMGGENRLVKTDRSYYMSILRPKVTDLTNEIQKLVEQEEKIANSGSTLMQLQQKHKAVADETVKLKQQLADLNFAVEKSVHGDPDALQFEAQQLRDSNSEKRKLVDKLFLEVKSVESQQRTLMLQLEEELHKLDSKLAAADPAAHAQYKAIRERAYRASDQVAAQQQELRAIIGKHESMMASLNNDPNKKKAALLTLELIKKRQQREELNKATSISVEEERQLLMNESRNNAQEIDVLKRKTVETKDSVQELRARLTTLEDDVSEYSSDNMKKYQELQERDREMQEIIDAFPAKEQEELNVLSKVELAIQQMLELISRRQKLKEEMPNQAGAGALAAQADDLSNQVEFGQSAIADIQATHARLQQQVKEKREEADMVANLDTKISAELEAIQEKIKREKDDIVRFSDLDALRREVEDRKDQLRQRKESLTKQREAAKQQLHLLARRVEAARTALNEDEISTSLTTQEQRLRGVYQAFFDLDDTVRSKEKEGSYTVDKIECLRLMDDCATMLASQQQQQRRVEFGAMMNMNNANNNNNAMMMNMTNGPQGRNVFKL